MKKNLTMLFKKKNAIKFLGFYIINNNKKTAF